MTRAWAMIAVSDYSNSSIGSIVKTIKSGIKVNKLLFLRVRYIQSAKVPVRLFFHQSNHLRVPVKFIIPLLNIAAIICKMYIVDCIANFHPLVATCRDRGKPA